MAAMIVFLLLGPAGVASRRGGMAGGLVGAPRVSGGVGIIASGMVVVATSRRIIGMGICGIGMAGCGIGIVSVLIGVAAVRLRVVMSRSGSCEDKGSKGEYGFHGLEDSQFRRAGRCGYSMTS